MSLTILCFGPIAAITGQARFTWPHTTNTERLKIALEMHFPELQGASYRIAVNRTLPVGSHPLADGAEIALLPPFSGG